MKQTDKMPTNPFKTRQQAALILLRLSHNVMAGVWPEDVTMQEVGAAIARAAGTSYMLQRGSKDFLVELTMGAVVGDKLLQMSSRTLEEELEAAAPMLATMAEIMT